MQRLTTALLISAALGATPALAHTGDGAAHGFAAGLIHPISGLDHVLAMTAVGLWAGLAGGRARWAWPAAFLAAMMAGALLGRAVMPIPSVEFLIAGSAVVLGAAVALRVQAPVALGAFLCAALALAHGHAHGSEIPPGADAEPYTLGFALATAALHAAGFALGRFGGLRMPVLAGGATAAAGIVLMMS